MNKFEYELELHYCTTCRKEVEHKVFVNDDDLEEGICTECGNEWVECEEE